MKKNDTEKAEISQPLPSQEVSETPEVPHDTPTSETLETPAEAPAGDVSSQEEAPEAPENAAVNEAPKKSPRKAKATIPDFLKEYVDAYPHNRTFHVTSDRMVFLEGDRGLAVMHQNSLPGGENVETYKIK